MKKLFLIIAMTLVANVFAEENPFQEQLQEYSARVQSDVVNPFLNGTEKIVLTAEDKQTLADYAYTSKVLLVRALEKAKGKTLSESHDIYVAAIKEVVMDSFRDKKRLELLMRYALNQALQLTIGVPTADGKSIQEKGVLADLVSQDVTTAILEDSMRLAIKYYQEDINAIRAGELVRLPYIQFGNERLAMAQTWAHSIHEPASLLNFQVATLQQWLATVANQEVLDRLKIGEAILDVDAAIEEVKSTRYTTLQKIRYLRGVMDTLFKTLARSGYRVAGGAVEAPLSQPAYQATRIAIDINEVDGYEHLVLINEFDQHVVIGQGYSQRYYYRDPRLYGDTKRGYKSFDEAEFRAHVAEKCAGYTEAYNLELTVCAPVGKIPRGYKYVTNDEFQDQFTIPFKIGIYKIAKNKAQE